jgi:DNA polymerase III sliding clamp (beta) subunit (PCNA family)
LKFKIDTSKMSYLLSKVANGVGKKYTQPITECLHIVLTERGKLEIKSTNGINFVNVTASEVEGKAGECVVKADMLIKLVDKTTKPELTFELKDTYLAVKGNGDYKVPVLNETFPTYEFNTEAPVVEVKTDVLKRVFKVNESAIAKELIVPQLTGYNVGDTCITTNGIKMCINNTKVTEERVLVTQALADLISKTFTSDVVSIQKDQNKLLIWSDNITIFGTELDGLQEYPDITGVLSFEFDNTVSVSKQELRSVLERLSLFVDEFDNNGIRAVFKDDSIEIEDFKENNHESVSYIDKNISTPDSMLLLSIEYLEDVIDAISSDVMEIQYSDNGTVIRINDGNVTLFLSTMNIPDEVK